MDQPDDALDFSSKPYQLRLHQQQRELLESAAHSAGRSLANWIKWTCSLAAVSPAAREALSRMEQGEQLIPNLEEGRYRYFLAGQEVGLSVVHELRRAGLLTRIPGTSQQRPGLYVAAEKR